MTDQDPEKELTLHASNEIKDTSGPIMSDEIPEKSPAEILPIRQYASILNEAHTLEVDYSSNVTDSPAKSQVSKTPSRLERLPEFIDQDTSARTGDNLSKAKSNEALTGNAELTELSEEGKGNPKKTTPFKTSRRRGYKLRTDRLVRPQTCEKPRPRSICPECKRPVVRLIKHMREMHKKEAPMRQKSFKAPAFPCPLCDQRFVRVDMHLEKKHKLCKDSEEYQTAKDEFYRIRTTLLAGEDKVEKQGVSHMDSSNVNRSSLSSPLLMDRQQAEPELDLSEGPKTPVTETCHTNRNEEATESDFEVSDIEAPSLPKELQQFTDWAQTFAGGWMTVDQTTKCVRHVRNILLDISDATDVRFLFRPSVIEDWVDKAVDKSSIATVIRYIYSLRKFCEYLKTEHGMIEAINIVDKVPGWNKKLRQKNAKPDWARRVKEREQFLDEEDLIKIDMARTTISALQTLNSDIPCVQDVREYNDVVAFLVLKTYLATGQRSGAVVNMTMDELQVARQSLQNDLAERKDTAITDHAMLVTVISHKTACHSPAVLRIPYGLAEHYFKYIDYLRPLSEDETVFVKMATKNKFKSTELNLLVRRKYELCVGKTLSATAIRKNVVTNVWDQRPELRGILARAMNHTEKTAEAYYAMPLQMHQSGTVGTVIEKMMKQTKAPAAATTIVEMTATANTIQQRSVFPTTTNISREENVTASSTITSSSEYEPALDNPN